jgi:hypothetical protein
MARCSAGRPPPVQVDRPDGSVVVDLLVHEQARRQEHLQRPEARLVQGQPARPDERVAAQPLHVHRPGRDADQVGVAAHVVEVVDREHARQQRLEPAQPARHRRVGQRPAWRSGTTASAGRSIRRGGARRARERRRARAGWPGSGSPSSRSMISCERSSWVRLLCRRRGSAGAGKWHRTCSSKKCANGPWPTSWSSPASRSVSTTRPSDGGSAAGSAPPARAQTRVQVAGPQPGLVHHAQAVGEAAVLGRGEDPARALELADAPHPLQPGRVEQIAFGRLLRRQPEPAACSGVSRLVSSM